MKGGWLPDRGHEREAIGAFIRTRDMRSWARIISVLKTEQLEWLGREILAYCDVIDRMSNELASRRAERVQLEARIVALQRQLKEHLATSGALPEVPPADPSVGGGN